MTDPSEQVVMAITGLARDAAYTAAGALSELIEPAADAVTIFEDGAAWRIDAYYSDRTTGQTVLSVLREMLPDAAARAELAPVVQQNWVAISQAALPPVEAGRFTVCGSHDLHRVPCGPNTIVIEAGEAFGTAHHATTYGCLLALDRLTRRGAYHNVLDLGTGSGILALALHRALPRASIIASDIDARSIEVARVNAERNGVVALGNGPKFIVSDGLGDNAVRSHAPFDMIVANILAGPLLTLAPAIAGCLAEDAKLVLSGILVPQAREICARYGSLGLRLERHDRHNGWSTLTLRMRGRPRRNRPIGTSGHNIYMPDTD